MTNLRFSSDHGYYWSESRRNLCAHPAPQTRGNGGQVAATGVVVARFADRTVQTLRLRGLQVPARSGAWSQVLSVDRPEGEAATDGLRPAGLPGRGPRVSGELPPGSTDPQTNLRHQLRTVAAARIAVRRHDARQGDAGSNRVRPPRNGRVVGQHAGSAPRVGRASSPRDGGSR